ncbi:MAG: RsiV family protein [Bacillota bacterium]|jgi:hypothetical protein
MATQTDVRAIPIPRVYGLPSRVARRINLHLVRMVTGLLRQQGYGRPQVSIWPEEEITLNEQAVFSLWYDVYAYPNRAAHGLTVRRSATYSLLTGRPYSLASLFSRGSNYIERLSDIIRQQIVTRQIPLIADFKQVSPNEGFFMTRDELVIYFQIYQYTPYAIGIPEFHIPYGEIADILAPDGPAYRFLG